MSDSNRIQKLKLKTMAELADVKSAPKSSYIIAGNTMSWKSRAASLQDRIDWCDAQIEEIEQ